MTGIVNNTVAVKADNMSEMVTITFTTGNGNNESGYLSVSGSGEYTYEGTGHVWNYQYIQLLKI